MKKWIKVIAVVVGVLVLSGCGKSAQEEFIEHLTPQTKYNAGHLAMSIEELDFNQSDFANESEEMLNVIVSQITDVRIEIDFVGDDKTKIVQSDVTLKTPMGDLPIEMFVDTNDQSVVVSGEIVPQVIAIMSAFTGETPQTNELVDQFAGKYVRLNGESMGMSNIPITQTSPNEAMSSEFLEKLDQDSFVKKGDKISHTFTREELNQLVADSQKNAEINNQAIQAQLDEIKDMTMEVEVDTKTDEQVYRLKMTPNHGEQNMTIVIRYTPKKSDEKVAFPTEDEILSEEVMTTLFSEESALTEPNISALTEEEFEGLLGLLDREETFTQDQRDQVVEIYGELLTEVQMTELLKMMDAKITAQ